MHNIQFVVRELILDKKQKVVAYRLALQNTEPSITQQDEIDGEYLAGFIAEQLNDEDEGWLMNDKLVFMDVVPALLTNFVLHDLPPRHTVFSLPIEEMENADTAANVRALRDLGFGICLRADQSTIEKLQSYPVANFVEVQLPDTEVAAQAKAYLAAKPPSVQMLGRPVGNWKDFDDCAELGIDVYVGDLYLTPRSGVQNSGLNPSQSIILKLMEMLQKNEDILKIEAVLKRDPAISYKLLRFINSAAFGLGREIQSLRQALSLLGYAPLYRWLSMLLATASTSGYSPVLMETAIARGRFAELLGQNALPKSDADNLFITGMFSLLDRLLGISMEEVLATIPLAKPIEEALLGRSGKYGPYLALAEACELDILEAGELATSLQLGSEAVNIAHISALEWTQNLGL